MILALVNGETNITHVVAYELTDDMKTSSLFRKKSNGFINLRLSVHVELL